MPDATAQYPWYKTIEGDRLEQGDILRNFDVLIPQSNFRPGSDDYTGELKSYDVIILTQSCDIAGENPKVQSLLLCPVHNLWTFIEAAKNRNENWGGKIREKLHQGNLPGYHLLNDVSQDGVDLPLAVADFHEIYTAPVAQAKEFAASCGIRLRLCPPYKEHLAQAFARFFMRVGLPVGIPMEKLKQKP